MRLQGYRETRRVLFLHAQNSLTWPKEVQRSGSKSGFRVQVVPACRFCCDLDASVLCRMQPQAGRGPSNHDFACSAFAALRRDIAFTLRHHCSRTCAGHFAAVTVERKRVMGSMGQLAS